jgi:hypothetical protein
MTHATEYLNAAGLSGEAHVKAMDLRRKARVYEHNFAWFKRTEGGNWVASGSTGSTGGALFIILPSLLETNLP